MILRCCVSFFCMMIMYLPGISQQYSVNGSVKDENNKPVPNASLHLLNTNKTVFSKADGSFTFYHLPAENFTLSVIAVGYASLQKNIAFTDTSFTINIQLHSSVKELDAVTVTAEKQEQNLQQLSVSISALTAKQIDEYRLWNNNQLTAIIPNLYTDNPGDGRNITSIRGIVTTSYDPAVTTYIDGVNQFSLDTYIGTLTDVERIEVLRGPQGTLYGRNAMGGVINIITKKPTNQVEGFAEINIGNHGLQRYNAGFRVPLVKNKLFLGATVLDMKRHGYYTNDFTGKKFDNQHLFYGNYYLTYLPSEKWMLTVNIKHQPNRNEGTFPLVNGVDEAFANPYHLSQDATAKMIDNSFNGSFVINHAGNKVNFNAISSYQSNRRTYNAPLDGDFSPADIVSIYNNYAKPWNLVKVFTQEVRLSSNNKNKKLQYTAGALFFYQDNPTKQATQFGALANAVYDLHDSLFSIVNTSKGFGNGIALYGQLQYSLTSKLVVTAGARYDYEHRRLSVENEYQKGDFSLVTLPDTSSKISFHAVSPKLSLQYLFSENSNVYATYSRGYRVGGLSPVSSDPSGPITLSSYEPENSNNYEIGSKNRWLNNKLQINLTAFLTYINNAQVPTLVLPDAITVIRNTGKLQTKGIEAEIQAAPLKGLQIEYNAGIIHTKYSSLKISQNGTEINLSGKKQIYTPSSTSMLAAQYNVYIAKQTKLLIRSEWQYRGKMYFDFANTLQQNDYSLINARAGFEVKHIGVYFWCRNIMNKKYIGYAYDFGAVHLGDPRTLGVTINTRL